jgi:RNA polymerase sigma factor (sigma-70 family)
MERSVRRVPPFQTFLEDHRATVHRFLRAAVGPHDVDDVFQETFLAALRAYPRLSEAERLDRWVLRIASRKAIDHHRATARRPAPVPDPPEAAVDAEEPPDDVLWKAVAELPPRQRVAVVHRLVLDRSYAEIAATMGGTREAARANVNAGVRRLKELVGWMRDD